MESFLVKILRGMCSYRISASFPFRVGKITISGKNCFDYCLENYQKTSFDFNIENDKMRASDETESSNPGEELDKG
jgi:hypothetical protein